MHNERPWSWADARTELAQLLDKMSQADAHAILVRLIAIESEDYLAPILTGLIRGAVQRRQGAPETGGSLQTPLIAPASRPGS